jgi:hypothetical protein
VFQGIAHRSREMRSPFLAVAAMTAATIAGTFVATSNADACAGLIGSNGAVNLGRTTTLAAYHNGEEHYVTSFEFSGTGGGEFGTLIPLPGIPSNVERGGAWTLQRLQIETSLKEALFAAPATGRAGALTVASRLSTRTCPEAKTTRPKSARPVSSSPSLSCHFFTAVAVDEVNSSSTVKPL